MKNWLFTVAAALLTVLSETGLSIQYPGIRSPIGSGTVPPSSLRSGLISSPNPIDTSGNLVITGHIRDGKYFRGEVPYGSATDFRAGLGSSALDSFLRDSAGSEDFRPYYSPMGATTGGYRPFYSPTGTVATTQPGWAGVFMPASTKIRGGAAYPGSDIPADGLSVGAVPQEESLSGWDASAIGLTSGVPQSRISGLGEYRPMSRTPEEIEKLISDELGRRFEASRLQYLRGEKLTVEQYQDQMEQIQRGLEPIDDELKQTLSAEDEHEPLLGLGETESLPYTQIDQREGVKELFESSQITRRQTQAATGRTSEAPTFGRMPSMGMDEQLEVSSGSKAGMKGAWESAEEMRSQLDRLRAAQLQKGTLAAGPEGGEQLPGTEIPAIGKTKGILDGEKQPYEKVYPVDGYGIEGPQGLVEMQRRKSLMGQDESLLAPELGASRRKSPLSDEVSKLLKTEEGASGLYEDTRAAGAQSQTDVSAEAKAILGKHETLASFSTDKFDRYLLAGETYLRQGKYYRAVDAYSLASIYKADEPLAYAGRSHALFAAGEYMSSTLFLLRALDIRPEYVRSKIDLAGLVGGKDKLDRCVADAEECLKLCRDAGSGIGGAAAELEFLLAYVYYRMDRLSAAKKAIDSAYEELPDSKAVLAVKKAIDDAIGPNTK